MSVTARIRNNVGVLLQAVVVSLLALLPAGAEVAEVVRITTADWRILKPVKGFKDLPVLMPREENGFKAGIGLPEFVCLKSSYYLLLVQPSVKLRDSETGTISLRAADAVDRGSQIDLTFRNLYKTRTLLSRNFDRDADIHFAEIAAALLDSIKSAVDLELTLGNRRYAISLSDLGSRLGTFQTYCEKGKVGNPAHFEK